MNKDLNIRRANLADLDVIVEIENLCFSDEKFSKRQLAYLISKAKGAFYIAESNNSILGYISLLQRSNNKTLRIYSLAVHPAFRGLQVGKRLIDVGKEFANNEGLYRISLEVKIDNLAAIRLYNRNEFVVTGVIPNYYENGEDAFRMEAIVHI